jgi:hypothetical protein
VDFLTRQSKKSEEMCSLKISYISKFREEMDLFTYKRTMWLMKTVVIHFGLKKSASNEIDRAYPNLEMKAIFVHKGISG